MTTAPVAPRKYPILTAVLLSTVVGILGWWFYSDWSFSRQFTRAQQAMREGRLEEAERELAPCLAARPDSGEVIFWSARLLRQKGERGAAHARLKRAKELDWVPEVIDLEQLLIRLQRGDRSSEGILINAIEKGHPDEVFILEALTPVLFANYQVDQASALALRWCEIQPERMNAWLLSARIANRRQDRDTEQKAYREVITRDPQHHEARLGLAESYLAQRRTTDALPLLESLVRDNPDDRATLIQLGKCRRMLGEFDAGRTILDGLLAKYPDAPEILSERGLIDWEDAKPVEAEQWFRKAVAKPPFDTETLLHLALALERNEKRAEATQRREEYKQAEIDLKRLREVTRQISQQPNDVALRREAGQLMLRNGHKTEGMRWLQSVLALAPNDPATKQLIEQYDKKP